MSEERKFLTSIAELLDRLTVDQIKLIKMNKESRPSLTQEIKDIKDDLDMLIEKKKIKIDSEFLRIVASLSLINLYIWNLKDEMSQENKDYDKKLKLAHQLNGIRNQLKNYLLDLSNDMNKASQRSNFGTDGLKGWNFNLDD